MIIQSHASKGAKFPVAYVDVLISALMLHTRIPYISYPIFFPFFPYRAYVSVIEQVLVYWKETWVVRRKNERSRPSEMKMLRRIKEVTRMGRLQNDDICQELEVINMVEQARKKSRLKWFHHFLRVDDD